MYPQDLLVLFPRHHPLVEGPFMGNIHVCIFCIRINLPVILSNWLNFGFWTHIVYIWIIVCYVFAFCGIWLALLLRMPFRLFCTFLLWPVCWASPHRPSHLCSGQTTMSTIDLSCYCCCNDYSSGRELQCQPMIMISFPQWSTLGSPSHLFNSMTLSPFQANSWHHSMRDLWSSLLLPSMLCGLWKTAFLQINGSDKLEYYTYSL